MSQTMVSDFDPAIEALSDIQRRRLLVALIEHNPQKDSGPLTTDVQLETDDLELKQAEMYHKHFPVLEELGFIEWDREAQEVVKGPKFDEIRPLVELIHNHRDR